MTREDRGRSLNSRTRMAMLGGGCGGPAALGSHLVAVRINASDDGGRGLCASGGPRPVAQPLQRADHHL
jgi:hypothetical protein